MSKLEKLKESIKNRARLTALSFLFLVGTTFVSCFCLYLPNWLWPHKYTAFELGSTFAGSFMGQVTLLVAMSIINVLFKKEDEPENIPARARKGKNDGPRNIGKHTAEQAGNFLFDLEIIPKEDIKDLPDIEGP